MRKIRFGLLGKFSFSIALVIVLVSLVLSMFITEIELARTRAEITSKGYSLARNLAYNAEYGVLSEHPAVLERLIRGVMEENDVVSVAVIDVQGRALSEAGKPGLRSDFEVEVPISSFELERAAEDIGLSPVALAGGRRSEKIIGSVKMGISLARAGVMVRQLLGLSVLASAVVGLLGVLSIVVLSRFLLVNPLKQFLAGTQKVAQGDLLHRIEVQSNDEIGDLSLSFNQMTIELGKAQDRLSDYAKSLEGKVEARTAELQKTVTMLKEASAALENKVSELQEFHDLTVGRELKMIELEDQLRRFRLDGPAPKDRV